MSSNTVLGLGMLDAESTRLLVDSRLQAPPLVRLRLAKARANLNALQKKGLSEEELLEVEDRLLSVEFNTEESERSRQTAPVKDQDDTPAASGHQKEAELDELNMLSSELSQRAGPGSEKDTLALQQLQQNKLGTDLLEMTAAIKRNAQLFQQKLDVDNDLVSQTGEAIQQTAGTMSKVGSQLSKYSRETIGWRFYIVSSVFILLVAMLGMFIIQIFGKW